MKPGIFSRQRRISNTVMALWLAVPLLLIAAGIAELQMDLTRYPWIQWSLGRYWVLALLFCPGLIYGFYLLARRLRYRQSMQYYRAGRDAIQQFEREYRHGDRIRFGKTLLTEHWLFSYFVASTCLLPLKEVTWIYNATSKERTRQGREYWVYKLKVHFRNGTILQVKCEKHNIDRAIREFAERCPQATFGYAEEREKAWKEGAKRWRISQ